MWNNKLFGFNIKVWRLSYYLLYAILDVFIYIYFQSSQKVIIKTIALKGSLEDFFQL